MSFRQSSVTFFHASTIGAAFATSYAIGAHQSYDNLIAGAFLFGFCCYLCIRLSYRQNSATDKVLFSAYRLINWSVPMVLFIIQFNAFFATTNLESYIQLSSIDEFSAWGPLALIIWPLHLFFFLIINPLIAISNFLIYLYLPFTIGLSLLLVVMLVLACQRLYNLKIQSALNFSISLAVLCALTPILLCSYLLIEVAPRHLPWLKSLHLV